MILLSLCNSCFQTFEIHTCKEDKHLLNQIRSSEDKNLCPCPRLCGGLINLVNFDHIKEMSMEGRLKAPLTLTTPELYRAVHGAGLPDEIPKDLYSITSILKANPIEEVKVVEEGGRFYLQEIQLKGDVTVHLSSGIRGAQVLKITKKETPYAHE